MRAADERVALERRGERRRPGVDRRCPRAAPARRRRCRAPRRAGPGRGPSARPGRAWCRARRAAGSAAPRTRAAPRPGCPPPRGPPSAAGGRTRGTAPRRSRRAPPARRCRARGRRCRRHASASASSPRRRIVSSSRRSSLTHGPSQSGRKVCRSIADARRGRGRRPRPSRGRRSPASARAARAGGELSTSTSIGSAGHEPQLGAAGERAVAERPAQLGEQRAERGVGRGGRPLGPQQVDQLGPAAVAIAVQDEVGEQQPTLPPRQGRAQGATAVIHPHRPTEPYGPPHLLTHSGDRRYSAAKVSPRFRQPACRIIRIAATGSTPPLRTATRTLRTHSGTGVARRFPHPLRRDRLTRDPRPWRRPALTPGRRREADAD